MLNFLKMLFGGRAAAAPTGGASSRTAVADRRRAETGLRHSEEHFGQLVAGVRDYAVFLLDAQGNVLTWNAGAERIKGYRPEEIIGQHFSRFYPRDAVSSGWPAHELTVAANTGRFEDEGWRVRKDGSKFWANVVITALRDEGGEIRGYLKITRDLTDRKQAEEKLRLSEGRFRLLVEGVKDYAIFMLDPQGRIATWNEGAQRIKGYSADEIIGQHFSVFYPKEVVERGWPDEELRRAAAEGRFEDEGWRVRKDGSQFWASVVITAVRDEGGALRGYSKVTRDLTDRRQAEQNARRLLQEEAARKAAEAAAHEIERQREQLHVTLSSIGDAVIVTDDKGDVTFLNPVAARLTGWGLPEAAGRPLEQVFRIINEETRQSVENPVDKVFRERAVVALANHTALVARDGREVPIEDSAAPIRVKDGNIGGAVLVFRDVTEARRMMETRLQLAAIVESSDDAIIGQSLDGRITSWNRGAERLYGYTAGEIVGKPLSLLVPSDRPDELPGIMARIGRGERIEHFETERVRKDGSRVDVALTISPITNREGKVTGASKIARDITARKEEDRRKNEFLALLSHELRNPLAPIRNGLQVMRLAGDDRPEVEQARTMMERQLQHLIRLVDDLLDMSRISQGKIELRKEQVDLAAAVHSAVETSRPLIEEMGHELAVMLPRPPVVVDADPTRLAQVFLNLLNNAAKYTERGGHIRLTGERQGSDVVVSVKDTGIGIPADQLPRLFTMFSQLDHSLERAQGGLGIGLTLVKRLVEMHGGGIEARSEGPGKGSEFVVRLPVVLEASKARETGNGEPAAVRSSLRILIVDDNRDGADSLAMMLRIMGNDTRTAYDGEEAVAAAAEFRPNVTLLDIGLPRLTGYEACRHIREQPGGKDMVLIAQTGWGQEEDRQRTREAGFDHHMVKPVDLQALMKLLAGLQAVKE